MIGSREILILHPDDRKKVYTVLADLDPAKKWKVTVGPYRKVRTKRQAGLMWVWLEEVVRHVHEDTGMDKGEIHDFFKEKFCPPSILEIGGEEVEHKTTTKLDTAQMSKYMDDIRAWCFSTLGIALSVPPSERSAA